MASLNRECHVKKSFCYEKKSIFQINLNISLKRDILEKETLLNKKFK